MEAPIKNRKKFIWLIAAAVVLLGLFAAFMIILYPKLKLRDRINHLMYGSYKLEMDVTMEGQKLPVIGDNVKLYLEGTRSNNQSDCHIFYDKKEYVELYMDEKNDLTINVSRLIEAILNQVNEDFLVNIPLTFLENSSFYVSLEQIEKIAGVDILTISDAGITSQVIKGLSGDKKYKKKVRVHNLNPSEVEDYFLGSRAWYFEIEIEDSEAEIIIGIPKSKSDNRIMTQIFYKDYSWIFNVAYENIADETIEIPKKTIPSGIIDLLSGIVENIKGKIQK